MWYNGKNSKKRRQVKATIFNASRTASKYPKSPYGDNTFKFETFDVQSISDVFNYLTSNFTLNMPLTKNLKAQRLKEHLKNHFQSKLEYIILDIDDLDVLSDREICLKYFRDNKWECVLGESRTDYRIKGVLKVDKITQKQGKMILKELDEILPGTMDTSSLNYASYQAPILKSNILYQGGNRIYPTPQPPAVVAVKAKSAPVLGVEGLCQDEFHKMGFSFDTPSQGGYTCSHPSEIKTKGGFTWNLEFPFLMTHWNQARNVSVWEQVIALDKYRNLQKEQSKGRVKEIIPNLKASTCHRYLDNNQEAVSDFLENNHILQIQSPMGTGKSAVIEEVIHQSRKKGLRILFLANRISLANDIEEKYDNVKSYIGTELEGNKYEVGDDLVVQIDSLWKFSTKIFDVVIMDEFTTTMSHLLTLEHHKAKITKQIFSFTKKQLVIADAFLFEGMTSAFENDQLSKSGVVSIINGYRDNVDLEFYTNKDYFIQEMLLETRPITFSSGSTNTLKIVKLLAEAQGKTTVTISAETPQEERKLIYKSMILKKPQYDILMYSPSLTVGVSNENEIGNHYHYDGGRSMNVLSSVQMIKRTRSAQKIRMYLSETTKYLPVDLDVIQSTMTDFNQEDDDGDSIGISDAGYKLSKIIQVNNVLENRHQVSFIELLKLQFKLNGNVSKNSNKVQRPFLAKLSKIIKKRETQERLSIFEEFKLLTPDEVSDIEYKMFATSKKEELIRAINKTTQDETLSNLSQEQMDVLIKGDLQVPGTIEHYKKILSDRSVISPKNSYSYSVSEAKSPKLRLINLVDFGYTKKAKKWVLQDSIIEILETTK